MNLQSYYSLAVKTSSSALDFLENQLPSSKDIINDHAKDIKIKADIDIQDFIAESLSHTKIPILGEENTTGVACDGYRWIIDPIDGTVNYYRGFPMACISIALWKGMLPIFGVIKDIYFKSMYCGFVGDQALLNDNAIQISSFTSQ